MQTMHIYMYKTHTSLYIGWISTRTHSCNNKIVEQYIRISGVNGWVLLSLTEKYRKHTITDEWDSKRWQRRYKWRNTHEKQEEEKKTWKTIGKEWMSERHNNDNNVNGWVSVTFGARTHTLTHVHCIAIRKWVYCEQVHLRSRSCNLIVIQYQSKFRSTSRVPNSFRQFHRNENLFIFIIEFHDWLREWEICTIHPYR